MINRPRRSPSLGRRAAAALYTPVIDKENETRAIFRVQADGHTRAFYTPASLCMHVRVCVCVCVCITAGVGTRCRVLLIFD